MVSVNKAELAELLKVSLPTLDKMIRRHGEAFPMLERGSNGREYGFDPEAVIAFFQKLRDDEAEAGRARDDLLRQFTLPGMDDPDGPAVLSANERLALGRLREIERREQRESGFLVETSAVRSTLANAFTRFNRELNAAVRQAMRDSNIPEPTIRQVEARIADAKRRCVEELQTYLADNGTQDAPANPSLV